MAFDTISENMTPEQRKKVHVIIQTTCVSVEVVLSNIMGLDALVWRSTQTSMIIAIGKVFGKELNETLAESFLDNVLKVSVREIVADSLMTFLPQIGMNATTAVRLTEKIGWIVANDFANDTATLDVDSLEKNSKKEVDFYGI